ncbi:hypothetical protein Bsp3421_003569 [Burkholderia sp. FERM BP-3421]|uniref:hypothetical protein n=1 Tax=Burkholderia sp. FERM BP-3421 TaxID=1494466 RepID=UPI002362047F|nr:hypothetical protein [Burkholderia sp. FERM BP-3421]WDD93484.1 hypothetical protein Bsp3421_003569 [Burkholderia sp. FERM BP-3421]
MAAGVGDQLALTAERDVRHYVELRFQYPHEFFAKDAALRDIFLKRQVQGKQRLLDAEARLTALATARA